MKTLEQQVQGQQLRYYKRKNLPVDAAKLFGIALVAGAIIFVIIGLLTMQSCGPKKPTAEERRQEAAERRIAHKNNLDIWNGTTEAKRRKLP